MSISLNSIDGNGLISVALESIHKCIGDFFLKGLYCRWKKST